jgi:hypothetical protein
VAFDSFPWRSRLKVLTLAVVALTTFGVLSVVTPAFARPRAAAATDRECKDWCLAVKPFSYTRWIPDRNSPYSDVYKKQVCNFKGCVTINLYFEHKYVCLWHCTDLK